MSSSEIDNTVTFKKELGLDFKIDQHYVGLKIKENNILSFNFRLPESLKNDVESYFKRFKIGEPIKIDIGGTGDISCYFKGTSPVIRQEDMGTEYYFISLTVQEIEKITSVDEAQMCDTCTNCGRH